MVQDQDNPAALPRVIRRTELASRPTKLTLELGSSGDLAANDRLRLAVMKANAALFDARLPAGPMEMTSLQAAAVRILRRRL